MEAPECRNLSGGPRAAFLSLIRLANARGSAAALDVHGKDNADAVGCSRLLGGTSVYRG